MKKFSNVHAVTARSTKVREVCAFAMFNQTSTGKPCTVIEVFLIVCAMILVCFVFYLIFLTSTKVVISNAFLQIWFNLTCYMAVVEDERDIMRTYEIIADLRKTSNMCFTLYF